MNVVGREVYTAFDYLSDVGGLFACLTSFFAAIVTPFAKT
jgi:hypothetical protein